MEDVLDRTFNLAGAMRFLCLGLFIGLILAICAGFVYPNLAVEGTIFLISGFVGMLLGARQKPLKAHRSTLVDGYFALGNFFSFLSLFSGEPVAPMGQDSVIPETTTIRQLLHYIAFGVNILLTAFLITKLPLNNYWYVVLAPIPAVLADTRHSLVPPYVLVIFQAVALTVLSLG